VNLSGGVLRLRTFMWAYREMSGGREPVFIVLVQGKLLLFFCLSACCRASRTRCETARRIVGATPNHVGLEMSLHYATTPRARLQQCNPKCTLPSYAEMFNYLRCAALHLSNACSADSWLIPQRSPSKFHVLIRIICSTARSLRMSMAKLSVLASRAKYRPEYGSRRSLTSLSRAFASSICRSTLSGSSGSGDVATPAQ